MRVLTWQEFTKRSSPARLAATVGVFDGVHLGQSDTHRDRQA